MLRTDPSWERCGCYAAYWRTLNPPVPATMLHSGVFRADQGWKAPGRCREPRQLRILSGESCNGRLWFLSTNRCASARSSQELDASENFSIGWIPAKKSLCQGGATFWFRKHGSLHRPLNLEGTGRFLSLRVAGSLFEYWAWLDLVWQGSPGNTLDMEPCPNWMVWLFLFLLSVST